jgi:Periplasmic lysozyme inhibitor of I-type lysozyme
MLATGFANADTVQARCDIYPKGQDRASAVVSCTFSQRQGYVSIDRSDGVRHELSPKGDQPGTYVDEKGRPAYRSRGLGSRGQIYRLADQTVYVDWDTAGLPGAAPAAATKAFAGAGTAAMPKVAPPEVPFDKTFTLQGITLRVKSANESSINTLEIIPSGLEIENRPMTRQIDGTVRGAEVADLNADGSPEIYVYVTSAGSGSYGSVVAYSVNRRKSLSEIYLPPVTANKAASKGYMGHDQFAVVESTFVQRFPIYRETDIQAKPTGGTRQLQYKLVAGEAGWILRLDRTVEY